MESLKRISAALLAMAQEIPTNLGGVTSAMKRFLRAIAALAFGAAQTCAYSTQVSGSWTADVSNGFLGQATFSCTLSNTTCDGVITHTNRKLTCPNADSYNGTIHIPGLNLASPGPVQGKWTFTYAGITSTTRNPDGTCSYSYGPSALAIPNAVGQWDGAAGTVTLDGVRPNGTVFHATGSFAADATTPVFSTTPPIIGVTVTSNITATTAMATAIIQPRAQDVGTNASIFVFAQAPSNLVSGTAQFDRAPASAPIGARAEDAVVCVLAQVNASGQLVAVSASTMQAYLTGVLTAQSQSLTLLGNVPTANVAGATLFVGYGASAASMLSSGVFQTAISIPGAVQCTARLDSAPAPKSAGALTGLWWSAAESGWGIHFTQRGSNTFAAWYTYDAAGKPKWYVSTCTGAGAASGTCSGVLYEVTGPAFFLATFNPSLVNAVNAGNLQATFRDANNASITYTVAGQTRTIALTRQPLAAGTTPPAIDYTDLWWNPNESGWGMAMTQQYGVTFLAWYVYDSNGKPTWLVATCLMTGSTCSGTLYRTTGPAFGPTFNPALVQASSAGSIVVSFLDANNAVISYVVDGGTATKSITRQLF